MDIEFLRKEFVRLKKGETIKDCSESIDIFCDFFISAMKEHQPTPNSTIQDRDAKVVLQMVMLKALNIRALIQGIGYDSKTGIRLNRIIDPTTVALIVRSIMETVATFNLIYRFNQGEERFIVHNLWALSGLNYRQRFGSNITKEENREKYESEKKSIEVMTQEIKDTSLYVGLEETDKKKISNLIKEKKFLVKFDNGRVDILDWQGLFLTMGLKKEVFDNIYTIFSFYAHPSNVSVFQFDNLFGDKKGYLQLTLLNLKFLFMCMGIIVADYINLYPETKSLYEKLPLIHQLIINSFNTNSRGYDYSINDTWKVLG